MYCPMTIVVTEKGIPMEVIIKCSDDNRGSVRIDGTPIEEIVRCKECRHWVYGKDLCTLHDMGMVANDYCSYGEKSE